LIGQLIIMDREIVHQDGRLGACHLDGQGPQLRRPVAPMLRIIGVFLGHMEPRPCGFIMEQMEPLQELTTVCPSAPAAWTDRMRRPNRCAVAKAVLDVALFALACIVLYAVAKALFDLLNVSLSFCC
jgi:hypothetical protein